jgi:urease gamma subunit
MVEPVVQELATEYDGQLKIGKLNVDRNPKTAAYYQIMGVPTFVLFQGGQVSEQRVGAQSRSQLVRMIRNALQGNESVSVIIPAYNEAARVGKTVREALQFASQVIVVDDGSVDETAKAAEAAGARVIQQANAGYIAAIKRGFKEASNDIIVTIDADGENCAAEIPRLVQPIQNGEADLVLGTRPEIARLSERFLNWLTTFRVETSDSGTGFRALRRDLALELELKGRCICGSSVLEPVALGARVAEVAVELTHVDKPRRIAWFHFTQTWYILQWLLKRQTSRVFNRESKGAAT